MAARLQIVIEADDKARATIVNLDQDLQRLGNTANTTGGPIDRLGNSWEVAAGLVVAGGSAIAAGLAVASMMAADFEEAMSVVGAVSGATASEMADLSQLALDLGQSTSFSAMAAAEGLGELAKGGLSIKDILDGAAEGMLNLAAAGKVDLATAANIATNALNQFGLSGKDMGQVANLIAGAANKSAIDVKQFGDSLAQGGAVAKLAGVSFEDFSTAVALLGNAGVKGSDAGTSLKNMLMNLSPTSKAAGDMMKQLGIVTASGANQFFDASGKVKSLADVSGVLKTSLNGLTEQQKLTALQTMFGADAIRVAGIMAGAGAEGFNTLSSAIADVSAADVAKRMMDNLKGSLEQFNGAVGVLAITVGMAINPALQTLVDKGLTPIAVAAIGVAKTLINDLTPAAKAMGDKLNEWMPTISSVIAMLGTALIGAITSVAGMLRDNAGPAIAATAAVLGLVLLPMLIAVTGAAWAAALPWIPIVLVLAAVGVAVYALGVAYQENLFGIRDTTEAVMAYITPTITEGFAYVVNWTQENWPLIQKTIAVWMEATRQYIEIITTVIGVLWAEWGDEIVATAQWAWEMISTIVGFFLGTTLDQITLMMQAMTGDWAGAHETMKRIADRGADAIGRVWTLLGQALQAIVSAATTTMVNQWNIWKNQMLGIVDAMTLPMRQKTEAWLNAISGAISTATAAGGAILSNIGTLASSMVEGIRSGISTRLSDIQSTIVTTVSNAVEGAKNQVTGVASLAGTLVNGIASAISNGVVTVQSSIVSLVSSGVTGAASGITGIAGLASSVISGIADNIRNGVGSISAAIRDAINSAIGGFNASTSSLSFNLGSVIVPGIGEVTFPTIGPLNLPDMPYLANGGIVTGPTVAMLGDNRSGREAIIPLERAGEMGFGGNTYNNHFHGPLNRGIDPKDMIKAQRRLDLLYGAA